MAAICLKSVGAIRSILNDSYQAIFDVNGDLTVLHFASCWPTGLSLLLSAGAGELINKRDQYHATALDYAMKFSCNEACEILLSHGAAWDQFMLRFTNRNESLECVHCLAGHLANRRKRLWCIAKETLSPRQLAQWKVGQDEFPDASARFIMEQILEAGAYVPEALMVSSDYEGIYISGKLYLEHFPLFYEAGFHEINSKSSLGLLPLSYVRTDILYRLPSTASEAALLQRDTFRWLKNHAYLDQSITDPQLLDLNTSATGWHSVALDSITHLSSTCITFSHQPSVRLFYNEVLGSQCRDSCRCWCSPQGCLPLTTWLKGACRLRHPNLWGRNGLLNHSPIFLDALRQVSMELLTYLTFEALEMTHTCCIFETFNHVPFSPGPPDVLIKRFLGNVHEIQDEEQELGARLEFLVQEFRSNLESSRDSLRESIYGSWSKRMAEECLPCHEDMEVLRQAGVNVDETCEFPNIFPQFLTHSPSR